MDLDRTITPDTGYVDITPFSIGYSDFSFLIWFVPTQPESKQIRTLFSYEIDDINPNYQFHLDLAPNGILSFYCSNADNSLSTGQSFTSLAPVNYNEINVVAVVRQHNQFTMYLNNQIVSSFKTREILKCYSYEADTQILSNSQRRFFRLGAKNSSNIDSMNQFDGEISRFVFKLEAFDNDVIQSYGANIATNFASSCPPLYDQPPPDYY